MSKLNLWLAAMALIGLVAAFPSTAEAQGSIDGTVTDAETGDAVSGAFVRAKVSMVRSWNVDFTDADGEFLIDDLDEGTYEVTVSRWGYAVATETVEVVDGGTTTVDFELEEPTFGDIDGTVTDADTGDPVEGAWVFVSGRYRFTFAVTDADGEFLLENVPTGDQQMRVWAWGYFSSRSMVEVIADETTTNDVELDPLTFGDISGTVTDADSGDAVAGARVSAGWWNVAFTDADGDYTLTDVVTGDRSVRTSAWGYYSDVTSVEVIADETATNDVALDPLAYGNVDGTITDADTGDPIEGATVRVGYGWWNSDWTNADGEYSIEDLLVGDYTVNVSAAGYYSGEATVTIEEDATVTVDVALDPLTYGDISGVVTDADTGDPIEGARVQIGNSWWNSATTDADGEYTIEDVLTGDYSVSCSADGYFFQSADATVSDGETTTLDFEMEPFTYGSISGVVTDADTGDPIEGARVQIGWAWWNAVYTDADGEYTLEDVLTGEQGVNVSAFGYFSNYDTVEVLDGETATHDVELTEW